MGEYVAGAVERGSDILPGGATWQEITSDLRLRYYMQKNRDLTFVVTCGYILFMKAKKKQTYSSPEVGVVVSVREAKAQFSALVARAATGEEITLSWHGQPRARLVPLRAAGEFFRVDRDWLSSMPVRGHGTRSEELVRAERDSRG